MEFKIFQNQNFNTFNDLEKYLQLEGNPKFIWESIEEIAVGMVKGQKAQICYFPMTNGCKMNLFSYKKMNHAIVLIYDDANSEMMKTYYYRCLRRLKSSSVRVAFLGENEKEIEEELKRILVQTVKTFQKKEVVLFNFHIEKRDQIPDFLNLCREHQVNGLEYSNTFPVDINEELSIGSFISKEIFLFSGEIPEENLNHFISGIIELGYHTDRFYFYKAQKVNQ